MPPHSKDALHRGIALSGQLRGRDELADSSQALQVVAVLQDLIHRLRTGDTSMALLPDADIQRKVSNS